jgi:type I restriction-modification system DNA methylase subunit
LFAEALGALIGEMESRPFEDLIGGHYMEFALSSKGQRWNGEFHTPKPICDLIARMTLGDPELLTPDGLITVCEPACGAGAMILSFAEACPPDVRRRLRVTAIDINRIACDMAFINTTLWGIPTRIIHGNSLSMEYWAAWSNIHYITPWLPLALRNQTPEAMEQGHPPTPAEVERIKVSLGQQELPLG